MPTFKSSKFSNYVNGKNDSVLAAKLAAREAAQTARCVANDDKTNEDILNCQKSWVKANQKDITSRDVKVY